jgi:hypothetical protein
MVGTSETILAGCPKCFKDESMNPSAAPCDREAVGMAPV